MLKVYSWNPNGLRSLLAKAKAQLQSFIETEQPDIVFFTETKGNPKSVCDETLRSVFKDRLWSFHHAYCQSSPGKHGVTVAIASDKVKVESVRCEDEEGRIIEVQCSVIGIDQLFRVIGVYIPNASTGLKRLPYKLDWMKQFALKYAKGTFDGVTIVIGDMNVVPSELDLANPKTNTKTPGFTLEERTGFAEMLRQCGLVDVWRSQHPDDKAYTFWTTRTNARERDIGWRLDHCLIDFTSHLECRSVICKNVTGSDHCPIGLHCLHSCL